MDDPLKEKADVLFEELGLNMTTAFNIFVRQAVKQGILHSFAPNAKKFPKILL